MLEKPLIGAMLLVALGEFCCYAPAEAEGICARQAEGEW